MKKLYVLLMVLFSVTLVWGQSLNDNGLNMPGAWNGWTNPPSNNLVFASAKQVSGGQVFRVEGLAHWHYQTMFNTLTTDGDVAADSYEFLFTSGPSDNYYANKWTDVNVSFNTIQTYTYHNDGGGTNDNITLTADKYYVMNFEDNGDNPTRAIFFELSDAPTEITAVSQYPDVSSVLANAPVTVTVNLDKNLAPEEKVIVRYTTDNWNTSQMLECNVNGTTATVDIPGQAANTTVSYYIFTTAYTDVLNLTDSKDIDLVTIYFDNNSGQNYSYTSNYVDENGINMPGSWDANNSGTWYNPPHNLVFTSGGQVSGGQITLDNGLVNKHYKTVFNTLSTNGDIVANSYEFLFASGSSDNYYANKWTDVNVSFNTIQTYTYHNDGGGTNDNITLNADKYYVMNFEDNGYADTRAIFFELSDAPTGITGVSQSPDINSVTENSTVTVTVNLEKTPTSEEKVILRYSIDNWTTSQMVECTVNGNTATADIPAQTANTTVSYYVFTTAYTDVLNLTDSKDIDLVTISYDNNSGNNYSYTVQAASSTGISELSNNNVLIYPNPVQDIVTISNAQGYMLEITDLQGRLVKTVNRLSENSQINLSDIMPGIYLFKFSKDGQSFVRKVTVK